MSQYDEFIRQQNIQKKKDAQQRQTDAQSLHTYNQALASLYRDAYGGIDASTKSSAYDAAKAKEADRAKLSILKAQMTEQETKWKEEYDVLMEENAKLKKQGEDALQASQWQERYEAAVKEKDEAMASIEKEKEKLIQMSQMEAAKSKEREQLSSQLFLQAVSTAQREKEKYEAALKEKDEAMEALQKERDSSKQLQDVDKAGMVEALQTETDNSKQLHDVDKAGMVVEHDGPSCADDLIDDEEADNLIDDEEDDNSSEFSLEVIDEEKGIAKEVRNNGIATVTEKNDQSNGKGIAEEVQNNGIAIATVTEKNDQIYWDETSPNTQNKNRRFLVIAGALFFGVAVIVAIAVPIAILFSRKNKTEPNNYVAQTSFICGRSIPIDLSNTSTWPSPSTPTLFQADYELSSITVVKNDTAFGSIGIQLNAFFRAFDYSHDKRLPLYITQDNYFFQTGFFNLFMGGYNKDASFWALLEGILGAKIVEDEAALNREGKFAMDHKTPEELNEYVGDELVATQIRNHRDTILRKLFQYPTLTGGNDDVCSLTQSEGSKKKYTVVHLSDEKTNSLLSKLNRSTGLDHSAAVEMSPDYVKAFLAPLKMLNSDIYPIATGEYGTVDTSVADRVEALMEDYVLGDLIRLPKENRHLGSVLYFAVLADVYIGNPVDHNSMWIARMRCALGLCSKTFILTKKTLIDWKTEWASYVNEDTYLELYDRETLGLWSG